MALLDEVKGMLAQYAAGNTPSGDAGAHFQQLAQSLDSGTLAQGIAAAIRSDSTPPFAQIISQLFASGSGDQKTAMLNTLLSSVSPEQRAQLSNLIPGLGSNATATSAQAASIAPSAVQTLAQHAEKNDGAVIDKMSTLYAQHPTLVKTLGAAAMAIAMRKIAERHQTV